MVLEDLQVRKSDMIKTEAASDYFGHSICTASKAAGRKKGSAKKERLVVVRTFDYSTACLAEVMWTVYNHVITNAHQGLSMVTVS